MKTESESKKTDHHQSIDRMACSLRSGRFSDPRRQSCSETLFLCAAISNQCLHRCKPLVNTPVEIADYTRIMTVDLEHDLRSNRCKSMEVIIPKLLDFFDDYNIRATFFTVTSLLEKYESEIKEISRKHEIASHSHTHQWLNKNNAEFEIKTSKEKLEEYGFKCSGFRAPKFIITKDHFQLLKKYGYMYDSSQATLFPQALKFTAIEGIYCFDLPAINSGLSYRKLLYPASTLFPSPKMFYLHPWEFLHKKDLPGARLNLTKYLLRRNSGQKAWIIFKNLIETKNYKWIGCKNYLESYPQFFP